MSESAYTATGARIHPAFAKFHEQTRRDCAVAFRDLDIRKSSTASVDVVVNGKPGRAKCCPLAFCLLREMVVRPILSDAHVYDTTIPFTDPAPHQVALVADDGVVMTTTSPDWYDIAHALGEFSAGPDNRPIPYEDAPLFSGNAFPDYPDDLPDPKRNGWVTRSSSRDLLDLRDDYPYFAFYDRWDQGAISPDELAHDFLGIDSLDQSGD